MRLLIELWNLDRDSDEPAQSIDVKIMQSIRSGASPMRRPKDQLPSVIRRLRAGRKLLAGNDTASVMDEFGYSKATVKKYKALVDEGGLEAPERMSVGGRRSGLGDEALRRLAQALDAPPETYSLDAGQWSDGKVVTLIERRFGIRFHRVYVWQLVTDMGLSHRLRRVRTPSAIGPTPALDSKAMSWLAAAIKHSPRAEGFDADTWNNERLRESIRKRYGVEFSRTYVWQLTRALGLAHLLTQRRK